MLVLLWTLRTCFGTEEQRLQQLLQQQQHHPDVRPSQEQSVSAWKMKNKIDAALRKEAYYTPSLSPSYGLQQQQQQQQQHQQQHQQDKTRKLKIQFTLSSDVSAYNQTLSITVFVTYFS